MSTTPPASSSRPRRMSYFAFALHYAKSYTCPSSVATVAARTSTAPAVCSPARSSTNQLNHIQATDDTDKKKKTLLLYPCYPCNPWLRSCHGLFVGGLPMLRFCRFIVIAIVFVITAAAMVPAQVR